MESLQNIKRHIRGVKNINQITKAMELVAATKMRRSQEIALASRPYAFAALDFLANLSRLEGTSLPPLLQKRESTHSTSSGSTPKTGLRTAIVVVTSDKGLAGAFNSAVLRDLEKFLKARKVDLHDPAFSFIGVGQKAVNYLERRTGRVLKKFVRFGDYTTLTEVEPLATLLVSGYLKGEWDKVLVFSTHFKSTLRQEVLRREILPVDFENLKAIARETIPETGRFAELRKENEFSVLNGAATATKEYLIEPSPEAVLHDLAAHLVRMEIYHLVLEANASEHAARRVAMKNASDNANELAGALSVAYNK